jgi:hypothetical protein
VKAHPTADDQAFILLDRRDPASMGYGYEVKELNDRTIKAAKKMVQLMGEIALPGALLVNILPLCESSFGI